MASAKRVSDEPAYILHQYDWSESSLILEVFTRHRGRVAIAAKGVKRHTSNFRPVLLPLQPLKLNYTLGAESNAEIHSLKGAEWAGGHVMPQGDALWSGMYLNELLLRLLARDDPYAALFDIYAGVVRVLAGQHGGSTDAIEPVLRAFELVLLRELGHLPDLMQESTTLHQVEMGLRYTLVADGGLRQPARAAHGGGRGIGPIGPAHAASAHPRQPAAAGAGPRCARSQRGPGHAAGQHPLPLRRQHARRRV